MGENQAYTSNAFFKVLLDSSASRISIPPNFTNRLGYKLPENCELEANGKSYSVECEKIDKLYYFTHGWLRFVVANALEDGYFLVFRLNQETSGFSVAIYDSSQTECCCGNHHLPDSLPTTSKRARVKEEPPHCSDEQRQPESNPTSDKPGRVKEEPIECAEEEHLLNSLPTSHKRGRVKEEPSLTTSNSETEETGSENSSESYNNIEIEDSGDDFNAGHEGSPDITCSNMSFSATFRKHSWVAIPEDFAVKTGIANHRRVMLMDGNGKRWPVELEPIKDGEMKLTNGWDYFKREFKVDPNVTCTFEFKGRSANNVLKVTVKRGRGRPFKIY